MRQIFSNNFSRFAKFEYHFQLSNTIDVKVLNRALYDLIEIQYRTELCRIVYKFRFWFFFVSVKSTILK